MTWQEFLDTQLGKEGATTQEGDRNVIASFGGFQAEYAALADGPAIVDRSYRGLLELRGDDRVPWLHNLTTNEVKNLGTGEGNYAFATNVQGRILFDLNVLMRDAAIWIDLHRTFLPVAKSHLDKYHIVEDVEIIDRSNEFIRIGLAGRKAVDILKELGVGHATAMSSIATANARWRDEKLTLIRHDFAGAFGAEFFVPSDRAVEFWKDLTREDRRVRAVPVGFAAADVRRIEAGIPWPGREITDEVLPAETGQLERAVSFQKGCYLGQEVVERMRSRGSLARRLCGLHCETEAPPEPGAAVASEDGKPVGRVTSACRSPALGGALALAYAKAASAAPGTRLTISQNAGAPAAAVVVLLPASAGAQER